MIKIKRKKVLTYVLVGIVVLQAGVVGYSMVNKELFSFTGSAGTQSTDSSGSTATAAQTTQTVNTSIITDNNDTTNTEISQEIQDLIKQSDPGNFDRNLANYKDLLVKLDVHVSFKDEIERLIKANHNIKDILTAYYFLYDNYGYKAELEQLVKEKESGKAWSDVFKDYNTKNQEYAPRSFNSGNLEKLMKTSGISKDDIMIADRVSFKTSVSVDDLISMRTSTPKWKVINASLEIINSQQKLPYVQVTAAEVNKYLSGSLTEEKVVQAFVIANKLSASSADVVGYMKDGLTKEAIYSKCLEAKYY